MAREKLESGSHEGIAQLETVDAQLAEGSRRSERLYEALSTGKLTIDDLSPRIREIRQRQEQLRAARLLAENQIRELEQDRVAPEVVAAYAADLYDLIQEGTLLQ